jgi:hypothetical protein
MKRIGMDINVGIGDHLFLRVFMDGIKNQFDQIAITHSRPGMQFWHNDNQKRWEFNLHLGRLLFSNPPYVLIPNARFSFYPNERIVKELNSKPVKPNIDCLCVGESLKINKYLVFTTKIRHITKSDFENIKPKLTPTLKKLSQHYQMVILGEREVERTREYDAECNKNQVYGIYDYLKETITENLVDLSIPALGITCSEMKQLQQDCLIMREAFAVITFGIGGNFWISTCAANQTIGFRTDNEPTTDLMHQGFPNLKLTKNIDQFISFLESLI